MTEKVRYKNPPIVERVIGVYYKLVPEEFEKRLPSWIEKIRHEYPVPEDLAEWTIDIENKNGVPFVKTLTPKARIIKVFWKKHKDHKHVIGMRLRADRLVFHLRREEDNPHDFDEIMPEMVKWMPLWAEHFGVPELEFVTVEYFNKLNGLVTPQLVNNGAVRVGDALNVFANIPGRHVGITDPYDCKIRLVLNEERTLYLDLKVVGETKTGSVKVNLTARTSSLKMSQEQAIQKINTCHDVILDYFSCVFSEKAKESFNL